MKSGRFRQVCRTAALISALVWGAVEPSQAQVTEMADASIRVATFNAGMARKGAGVLIADMDKGDNQVRAVAEIVLRVAPDILLINEIDYDPGGLALARLQALLAAGVGDVAGIEYEHHFIAASNTGVPSGFDLDGDGRVSGARDALGFGRFPGQYGMAILSRVPLGAARTFRTLKWAEIPWAEVPMNPDGSPYYAPDAWAALPLSSKSHWDVVAETPFGPLHLLASHPTPPVFDGPENRNGLRNAAEIRFWSDYIDGAAWIVDDEGAEGGLTEDARFVLLGDLNADPLKGDGDNATVAALLNHPRIQDPRPESAGAASAGVGADAALNTADWPERDGPGDLRVDYALPSANLAVAATGVFWPAPGDPLAKLVELRGRRHASSDHRLVWVDVRLNGP